MYLGDVDNSTGSLDFSDPLNVTSNQVANPSKYPQPGSNSNSYIIF